jgi:RimJ/RimL family protein N-acetyltransferase
MIGWTLHPDFTGHGYATEAASAILRDEWLAADRS